MLKMRMKQWAMLGILRPQRGMSSLFLATLCLLAILSGLGLQYGLGFDPCPLCIFQRIGFVFCALLFGGAALVQKHPCLSKILHSLGGIVALIGLGIACQHLYIAYYPVAESCGADLEYLSEILDTGSLLAKVFKGDAECAEAGQRIFLWMPVPAWSLSLFTFIVVQALRTMSHELRATPKSSC